MSGLDGVSNVLRRGVTFPTNSEGFENSLPETKLEIPFIAIRDQYSELIGQVSFALDKMVELGKYQQESLMGFKKFQAQFESVFNEAVQKFQDKSSDQTNSAFSISEFLAPITFDFFETILLFPQQNIHVDVDSIIEDLTSLDSLQSKYFCTVFKAMKILLGLEAEKCSAMKKIVDYFSSENRLPSLRNKSLLNGRRGVLRSTTERPPVAWTISSGQPTEKVYGAAPLRSIGGLASRSSEKTPSDTLHKHLLSKRITGYTQDLRVAISHLYTLKIPNPIEFLIRHKLISRIDSELMSLFKIQEKADNRDYDGILAEIEKLDPQHQERAYFILEIERIKGEKDGVSEITFQIPDFVKEDPKNQQCFNFERIKKLARDKQYDKLNQQLQSLDELYKQEAWIEIAKIQIENKDLNEANGTISLIEDKNTKNMILRDSRQCLSKLNKKLFELIEEGEYQTVLDKIKAQEPNDKNTMLAKIAEGYCNKGLLNEAKSIVEMISDDFYKKYVLLHVAKGYGKKQDYKNMDKILMASEAIPWGLHEPVAGLDKVVVEIVVLLTVNKEDERAYQIAKQYIKDNNTKTYKAFKKIIEINLAREGDFIKAFNMAQKICSENGEFDVFYKAAIFKGIFEKIDENSDIDLIKNQILNLDCAALKCEEKIKNLLLMDLSNILAQNPGHMDKSIEIVQLVVGDEGFRSNFFKGIGGQFIRQGHLENAQQKIVPLLDEKSKEEFQKSIPSDLLSGGYYLKAIALFDFSTATGFEIASFEQAIDVYFKDFKEEQDMEHLSDQILLSGRTKIRWLLKVLSKFKYYTKVAEITQKDLQSYQEGERSAMMPYDSGKGSQLTYPSITPLANHKLEILQNFQLIISAQIKNSDFGDALNTLQSLKETLETLKEDNYGSYIASIVKDYNDIAKELLQKGRVFEAFEALKSMPYEKQLQGLNPLPGDTLYEIVEGLAEENVERAINLVKEDPFFQFFLRSENQIISFEKIVSILAKVYQKNKEKVKRELMVQLGAFKV